MTPPDHPLRVEFSVEVPGTPDEVWAAIATAAGMSSWFLPTDMEEREGGAIAFHMGEDSSEGTVTGWEPPRRLVYEEPHWAALTGHDDAEVTPLVSEFLVEASSGGTCVVHVVSSAFGSGADWEAEFFEEMGAQWQAMFDHNLALYLTHFRGRTATTLSASASVDRQVDDVRAAMLRELGSPTLGATVTALDLTGEVRRLDDGVVLLSLDDPFPGLLQLGVYGPPGGDATVLQVEGQLFADDAPAYVERRQGAWQDWLTSLGAGNPLDLDPA